MSRFPCHLLSKSRSAPSMSHLSRSFIRRVPRRSFVTVHFGGPSASNKSRWLLMLTLSGFAGGAAATAVGGYALYRWSGLGDVVDKFRHSTRKPERKSDSQNETVPQLFSALRMLAKAYVAGIPGAGILVDTAFDQVEGIAVAHQDEARAILKTAMEDIQTAVKARGADSKTAAWDVLIILRDKLGQIQASASEAGQNKIGPLFENFHGFREHVSQCIPGTLASMQSLWSAGQKRLEKGKNFLLEVSERRNFGSNSVPSAEGIISSNPVQDETSTQDSSTNQSGGNAA